MRSGLAFLLNLDAERELAGAPADPFRELEDRPGLLVALAQLTREHRVAAREDLGSRSLAGREGRAWCPTPAALDALGRCGAAPPPAPPIDVLRRVNDRAFSIASPPDGVRPELEGIVARSIEEAEAALAKPSPSGKYLLKQPLGFAGRGRLVAPSGGDRERAFVRSSIERFGSVVVEPFLERELDVALHGFIHRSGASVLGRPTVASVSAGGVHQGSRPARPGELSAGEVRCLERDGDLVARVLRAAGYFGPFGIDGFRWRMPGASGLRPRCEINARYTIGWAIGMGDLRPDLDADR